jgi:hypothetical protein
MDWRINAFDDFPFHQAIAPIDVPEQVHPRFNDGYWFGFYREGVYAFCGLRLFPNTNVIDGYAGVVYEGVQRNVRFSRALRPRTNELAVGPFRLQVLDPLQRQRLVLGPNPSGVEWDVEIEARALWPESAHVQYRHGVILNHVLRYTGITRANGWIAVDGERMEVDRWYGARDHSWGIRASMGPRWPFGGAEEGVRDPRAMRLWMPYECGPERGFFHMHEDADGNVLDFEGEIRSDDGRVVKLVEARHALEYEAGSRRVSGGAYTLVDTQGVERDYRFKIVCEPGHPQGYGYTRGWSDGGSPGIWRGPEVIESNRFDVTDPNSGGGGEHLPDRQKLGGTEFAASLEGPDGTTGMVHVEHMIYGTYRPYGFEGPPQWAKPSVTADQG